MARLLTVDIEHIDALVEMRADLGGADREAELEQRAGDGVEQAHLVVGEGSDDRELLGSRVIDRDTRGQVLDGRRLGRLAVMPKLAKDGRPPGIVPQGSD